MKPEELLSALEPIQQKKGYYFYYERPWVLDVLESLETNKKRYGYASCPCRLATGDRQRDRDIICPCAFREEDVRKYGRCYCKLYVDRETAELHKDIPETIPERWLRK